MRGLFRIVFLLALVYTAISVVRGLISAFAAPRTKREVPGSEGLGKLVKDPICGTYIPERSAIHSGDYFFCSEECRGKFLNAGIPS
jgi:YHS domain-containing protein